MLGIYAYFDKKDNSVAYVGKDSNIEINKRHKDHQMPSNYDKQPFNRILQSNPNRYSYQVLVWNVKDQETLTALEVQNIRQLKPKFNYTIGGDGTTGYKHNTDSRKKMSESTKGKNHPNYGKNLSDETCAKISESLRKYSLWDGKTVHYDKSMMFQRNREPNPCKYFRLKYDGYDVPCGTFMDFTSVEIINDIFNGRDLNGNN